MDKEGNSTSLEARLPAGGTRILQFVEDGIQTTMLTGIAVGAAVALLIIGVVVFVIYKRVKRSKQLQPHVPQYRFRKRDKVMFYGRKIMRKANGRRIRQGRFSLDIRRRFFSQKAVEHWNSSPGKQSRHQA